MIEYLCREDQAKLRDVLAEIPELVENLAAAIAKPYEAISYQPRVSTGDRPSPLPYDPSAEDASRYLHNELWRWTSWLANERDLEPPQLYPAHMARWLTDHMATLATTPGSEPAYANIATEVKAAKRATGRKQADPIYAADIIPIRNQQYNASGIAALAQQVGILGLTRRRVHSLHEHGHITPQRTIPNGKRDIPIYRLGDVLDAHENTQQRNTAV